MVSWLRLPRIVRLGCCVALVAASPDIARSQAPSHDRQLLLHFTAGYDILVWPTGSTLSGCFFLGERVHRRMVVEAAAEWSATGNIRFDFGQAPGYRDCDSAKPSDIRVGFQSDLASRSHLGTRTTDAAPNRPTMFIGIGGATGRRSEDIREAALHELGHALALPHEHQHPASPCAADLKIAAVCERQDIFATYSDRERQETLMMMQEQVRLRRDINLSRLPRHDVVSIMHYRFPAALLGAGADSACHTLAARVVSDADKAKIAERYPAEPDAQRMFVQARGAILAEDLHQSGFTTDQAERLARLAEAYVARSFPGLAFSVPFDPTQITVPVAAQARAETDAAAALCQPRRP